MVDGGSKDNSVDLIKKYEHCTWVDREKGPRPPRPRRGLLRRSRRDFLLRQLQQHFRPGALATSRKFERPGRPVSGLGRVFQSSGDQWEYSVKTQQRLGSAQPRPAVSSFLSGPKPKGRAPEKFSGASTTNTQLTVSLHRLPQPS